MILGTEVNSDSAMPEAAMPPTQNTPTTYWPYAPCVRLDTGHLGLSPSLPYPRCLFSSLPTTAGGTDAERASVLAQRPDFKSFYKFLEGLNTTPLDVNKATVEILKHESPVGLQMASGAGITGSKLATLRPKTAVMLL